MKKLEVAVIGTGSWGKNHARVYKELATTELIAICDVNPERAKIMANQYGVKALEVAQAAMQFSIKKQSNKLGKIKLF